MYVLMTRRTTALYRAVFQRIKLANGLQERLVRTMSDFETAIIAAIRAEFPNCEISECDFHFKQVKCFLKFILYYTSTIISVLIGSLPKSFFLAMNYFLFEFIKIKLLICMQNIKVLLYLFVSVIQHLSRVLNF